MREKLVNILMGLQVTAQGVKDPVKWFEGRGLDCPSKIQESCEETQKALDQLVQDLTALID